MANPHGSAIAWASLIHAAGGSPPPKQQRTPPVRCPLNGATTAYRTSGTSPPWDLTPADFLWAGYCAFAGRCINVVWRTGELDSRRNAASNTGPPSSGLLSGSVPLYPNSLTRGRLSCQGLPVRGAAAPRSHILCSWAGWNASHPQLHSLATGLSSLPGNVPCVVSGRRATAHRGCGRSCLCSPCCAAAGEIAKLSPRTESLPRFVSHGHKPP